MTPDQTLDGATLAGIATKPIDVVDLGAGAHTLDVNGIFATVFTPALVPVNVPAGALTTILQLTVPTAGLWYFTANTNSNPPLPGAINARLIIDNGGSFIGEDTHQSAITTNISTIGHSVVSYLINCAGAEVITASMIQDSAGAIDVNCTLNGIRIGK